MKKHYFIPIVLILFTMCKPKTENTTTTEEISNPFFTEWQTPFNVPPFDKIKNEHYLPAVKEGIKQINQEIEAIIATQEEPDFENTIVAFDKTGDLLMSVRNVFQNLKSANADAEMQELAKTIVPMFSKSDDEIYMNPQLFKRVKAVYDKKETLSLDASQLRALDIHYRNFIRRGAGLDSTNKEKLKALNEKLTTLSLEFGQNLLKETNSSLKLVIDDEKDLAGLPEAIVAGAAEAAKLDSLAGKWLFTLHKPSLIPFLQFAENRELREKIYKGYYMRANNNNDSDNKEVLKQMALLRAERAKLFSKNNHAEFVIDINMAKTPQNVFSFLDKLWEPALKISKKEREEMQAIIDAEGGDFKLASWDWWYYAEKLRKQKYDLDEAQLAPYFKLENVRDGIFWVSNKLYGITFHKIEDAPIYHKDVEVYEVKEANGEHLAVLYLDYHPRESKRAGAWNTSFRDVKYRDGKRSQSIQSIVCNFTKPTGDLPALLNWDEVNTLFHEFGHALHFMFVDGKYDATAGLVARDYVELPSQFMENYASEPEVLKQYAKHYKTGEVIPDELVAKIKKSGHFNQGFATVEYLAASYLDLAYHTLEYGQDIEDVLAFEQAAMDKIGLIDEIIPRYRSTYFAHIFSGGYSAGYYVYTWAAVLDADAYQAFVESGDIFNPELAQKFRQHCLTQCGEDEGMTQYKKFRGKDPSVEPLLARKGLK